MRTSRLARDTARFAEALPPSRLKARERPPHSSTTSTTDRRIKLEERAEADSDSALSSAPSDLEDGTSFSTPHKRKRATGTLSINIGTTPTRPPPRKTAASNDKPKKAKRQPAKEVAHVDGQIKMEPPANWKEIYDITAEMRALWQAPVDTMGCESLTEEHRSPRDKRFQTLVSLMLSSQTKDTVTSLAMKNLQENLPGGLTVESILAVDPILLNDLITKVGFHNNKTRFLKATALILRDQHDSDIPSTIEGMIALPGVGPKMAYLCMSAAWGRDEGIGVDVHVHRITNLWGWHKTRNPEQTRLQLQNWLPSEKWHDINKLLVGFGQTYCPPVGRKCGECRLAEQGLCPSAVLGSTVKKIKKKEVVVKEQEEVVEMKREVSVKLEEDVPVNEEVEVTMEEGDPILDIEDIGSNWPRSRNST